MRTALGERGETRARARTQKRNGEGEERGEEMLLGEDGRGDREPGNCSRNRLDVQQATASTRLFSSLCRLRMGFPGLPSPRSQLVSL